METKKLFASCAEARQIDLVGYLANLGYQPVKVRHRDYWYLSPLREEKTPSFKMNQKLNRWYDHGLGGGGNLIDFAVRYYGCTVREWPLWSFSLCRYLQQRSIPLELAKRYCQEVVYQLNGKTQVALGFKNDA